MDRPKIQKHHSSSSVQLAARSPGASITTLGVKHVVSGPRSRLGARVPSYNRNVNKLGRLTTAQVASRPGIPRNNSKTFLRKNKSETALHRRNHSSSDTIQDVAAQNADLSPTDPKLDIDRTSSAKKRGSKAKRRKQSLEVEEDDMSTYEDVADENMSFGRNEEFEDPIPLGQRPEENAIPDDQVIPNSYRQETKEYKERIMRLANRERIKPADIGQDEFVQRPDDARESKEDVPIQPKDCIVTAKEEADTLKAEVSQSPPTAQEPSGRRHVKFSIGSTTEAEEKGDTWADENLPSPTADADMKSPPNLRDQTAPAMGSQSRNMSWASGPSHLQSTLNRDREQQQQPRYDLPPSAWKSHRLIEVTPHLTDPRSPYTGKFLDRLDREIDQKLSNLDSVQNQLYAALDRMAAKGLLDPDASQQAEPVSFSRQHAAQRINRSTSGLANLFGLGSGSSRSASFRSTSSRDATNSSLSQARAGHAGRAGAVRNVPDHERFNLTPEEDVWLEQQADDLVTIMRDRPHTRCAIQSTLDRAAKVKEHPGEFDGWDVTGASAAEGSGIST